jgi:hypothetical protein
VKIRKEKCTKLVSIHVIVDMMHGADDIKNGRFLQTTCGHIAEGSIFHSHCHNNFKSHIEILIYKLHFFPDRCNSRRINHRT